MHLLILSQCRDLKYNMRKLRSLTTVRGKRTFESVVVGGDLLETSEDCSTDSYNSQIWSGP